MGLDALRGLVVALAALVVAAGAAYSLLVGRALGLAVSVPVLAQGALMSLAPGLAVILVGRLARGHRQALWTALGGALLVLALGVALYAVALQSPLGRAPYVAVRLVPLRQLAAAAFVAWAVWLVRRSR